MGPKTLIPIAGGRLAHHSVDSANHGLAAAPGMVTGQQLTFERVTHKSLRRDKHLRLGPAKAINALLGVPHDENTGCGAPRAGITTEPARQRLPLQRVGVLKFVNHQMPDARVQPLLHPARQHRVTQHHLCGAFHIVHVDPAALTLERSKLGQQQARQARHAPLVVPGFMLGDRAA